MKILKSNRNFLILIIVFSALGVLDNNLVNGGKFNVFGDRQKDKEKIASSTAEVKAYANYCIAIDMMLESNWEEAVKYLTRVLEADPLSEKAHLYLSSCYFQSNQKELAISHLEKAAIITPEDFHIHYTLGSMFQSDGNYDKAITEFELAIGCNIENNKLLYGNVLISLGNLYVKKHDIDKAVSCLNAVIDLNITNDPSMLYYEIGKLYYNNDDLENASHTFEIVKNLNPLISNVHGYLATCYERLGKLEKAAFEIKTFLKGSPNSWNMHIALYRIYNQKEDNDLADEHLQKAINILNKRIVLGSNDLDEYITLGQLLLNQNLERQALTILNSGLLLCKDKTKKRDMHFMLSNVYYELNQFDNVENELKMVLEIDDNLHQANNFLGYLYAERGRNLDKAIDLIQKALDAEPENAAYLDSLGWAYFKKATANDKKNKIKEALKILRKAAQMSNDPEIQEHIGDVYYSFGKWNKAEKEWTKALKFSEKIDSKNNLKVAVRLRSKIEKLSDLRFSDKLDKKVLSNLKHVNVN
ncbi:MAG: tetratricopeptide repeat protein [Candidatus Anammoxibacter sp.]